MVDSFFCSLHQNDFDYFYIWSCFHVDPLFITMSKKPDRKVWVFLHDLMLSCLQTLISETCSDYYWPTRAGKTVWKNTIFLFLWPLSLLFIKISIIIKLQVLYFSLYITIIIYFTSDSSTCKFPFKIKPILCQITNQAFILSRHLHFSLELKGRAADGSEA